MKKGYTHINVLLDRSASMISISTDTIKGFNTFIKNQKTEPGYATLTLVQFDSVNPFEIIHRFKNIKDVPRLSKKTFIPRENTPLLDAIGNCIYDVSKNIEEIKEEDRPEKIIIVIITDGQENASQKFKLDRIQKLIEIYQKKANWQFLFLSSDMDAISDALDTGFYKHHTLSFDPTSSGVKSAWKSTSDRIVEFRAGRLQEIEFTNEEQGKRDSEKIKELKPKTQEIESLITLKEDKS